MNEGKYKILIVDDTGPSRNVLGDFVTSLGYEPVLAEDGKTAIEQLRLASFDAVLLDILMPEMSGFQVLKNIKQDKILKHLPVIMISAMDELDFVAACLQNGADDYLTKPFNPVLLKARLESILSKKRFHDREIEHQQELEAEVTRKTRELADAYEKLQILNRAKNDFINLISHELRTPLTGLGGVAQILFSKSQENEDNINDLYGIYINAYERLENIVDQAILLTEIDLSENFRSETHAFNYILESALEIAELMAEPRKVTLTHFDEFPEQVIGDFNLLNRAFSELFKTAVKFAAESTAVKVACKCEANQAKVTVESTGYTIPEKLLSGFFDPLTITDTITPGGDFGLSPVISKRVLELFDGKLLVANRGSEGVVFIVEIPVIAPETE